MEHGHAVDATGLLHTFDGIAGARRVRITVRRDHDSDGRRLDETNGPGGAPDTAPVAEPRSAGHRDKGAATGCRCEQVG